MPVDILTLHSVPPSQALTSPVPMAQAEELAALQGMTFPLLRHRGDVDFASRAIGTARRRLRHNGGLLHRLHPHGNPAFDEADATFQSLEVFLARPRPRTA